MKTALALIDSRAVEERQILEEKGSWGWAASKSRYRSGMVVVLPSAEQGPSKNYFLLTSLLVPRPIAWVTTHAPDGVANLAPFSFYGGISGDPPILGLGIARRRDGTPKDTARNALETGELVVHLTEAPQFEAMVGSSAELGVRESEIDHLGLAVEPSQMVAVPSLKDARVRLECRIHAHHEVGHGPVDFLMAEVLAFVIDDDLIDEQGRVREAELRPLARHGGAFYSRTESLFARERPRQS